MYIWIIISVLMIVVGVMGFVASTRRRREFERESRQRSRRHRRKHRH